MSTISAATTPTEIAIARPHLPEPRKPDQSRRRIGGLPLGLLTRQREHELVILSVGEGGAQVVHLEDGRIVGTGSYAEVVQGPGGPVEARYVRYVPAGSFGLATSSACTQPR